MFVNKTLRMAIVQICVETSIASNTSANVANIPSDYYPKFQPYSIYAGANGGTNYARMHINPDNGGIYIINYSGSAIANGYGRIIYNY
jgi:hypothetical protein